MIPSGLIQSYATIPTLIYNQKINGLFMATADGSNNFTDYGIVEGSLLLFDSNLERPRDFPSCYIHAATKKLRVLRNSKRGYQYLGKLVAVINTFQEL